MERTDLDNLADMAQLELSPEERTRLGRDLERLLEHFAMLAEVDVTGVEASPYPRPLSLQTRTDHPGDPLPENVALSNAPQLRRGHFVVPKMFEG